jgi:hypothetical protein
MTESNIDRAVGFAIDNWEALGVAEHDGSLFLPTSIKHRRKDGGVSETLVMLRNVSNHNRFKARIEARGYAKTIGLDLDRDAALVDEIENYALLVYAIRDRKPPHDQHAPDLATLIQRYDTQSLAELWGRYNIWIEMLDPRYGEMTEDDLWNTIVRIAREKNAGFLAGIPVHAQPTFIVCMAEAALSSPMRPSWLKPPETSPAAA